MFEQKKQPSTNHQWRCQIFPSRCLSLEFTVMPVTHCSGSVCFVCSLFIVSHIHDVVAPARVRRLSTHSCFIPVRSFSRNWIRGKTMLSAIWLASSEWSAFSWTTHTQGNTNQAETEEGRATPATHSAGFSFSPRCRRHWLPILVALVELGAG